jgi:hypothetical protein
MERPGSLPYSQQPTTCPYSKPFNPVQALPHYLFTIRLNVIVQSATKCSTLFPQNSVGSS